MRRFKPSRSNAKLPDDTLVSIESLSHDGRGIGRVHGRVLMIENALPGEQVLAQITKASSKLWQGRVRRYLEKSESRHKPACDVYGRCGGCQLQHLSHADQVTLKEDTIRDQLRRHQVGVESWEPALRSEPWQYRHRARLHVSQSGQLGFHEAQGKRVIESAKCPVMTAELHEAFLLLKRDAPLLGIEQLELVVDDTGQVGVIGLKGKPKGLTKLHEWANEQGWVTDAALSYEANTQTTFANAGEFTQVNRAINQRMARQAADWLSLDADDRLLDLFCGNGNLSLGFASQTDAILGYEASEAAIFQANRASLELSNVHYQVADLFTVDLHEQRELMDFAPTVAVLDPPRAGAERCSRWLGKVPSLTKLLYISCDPATLARDLANLVQDDWHLRKVGLIDMFPQTRHIETMALLEK
jgi:23S rRNA (uracil1939-C5)-methyltransferase